MVGCVLDWVVLHTVEDGDLMPSGEQIVTNYTVAHWAKYPKKALDHQPIFKKILDVGSYDVNGSLATYDFFGRADKWTHLVKGEVTGIDLGEGPGVDYVMNAQDMTFKSNTFDLILCLEMLEHDDDPAQSIKEMARVLKPGQPLILTCPDDQSPEHHQGVSDHYSFITSESLQKWLRDAGLQLQDYQRTKPDGGGHHLTYSVKAK